MCLDFIYKIIFGIEPPKDKVKTGWFEVYKALKENYPEADIHITDHDLELCSKEEIARFLKADSTDLNFYVSQYHDCDDFSFQLMGAMNKPGWSGLAFGIMFTEVPNGKHAVNCFVDKYFQTWIVEPQNDKIFQKPDDWIPYFILI